MTSVRIGRSHDPAVVVGVVACSAAVAWVTLRTERAPVAAGATVLAVVAGAIAARHLATRYPWIFPSAVAVAGTALLVIPGPSVLDPLRGPLGYGNATAAAAVLAGASAWVAATRAPAPVRAVGWTVGAVLLAVPVWTDAHAATLGSLAVVAGLVGPATRRAHRLRLLVLAGALLTVLGATTLLAAAHGRSDGAASSARAAAVAVSERRLDLWADALDLWQQEPVIGIGLGQFEQRSHTARTDRDAARAHHEYLQLVAETGLVGLLAGIGVMVSLATMMWRTVPDRGTTVAVMALGGVFVHAAVDHVLHFAVVVVGVVALVGVATADTHGVVTDSRSHSGPFRRRSDSLW